MTGDMKACISQSFRWDLLSKTENVRRVDGQREVRDKSYEEWNQNIEAKLVNVEEVTTHWPASIRLNTVRTVLQSSSNIKRPYEHMIK